MSDRDDFKRALAAHAAVDPFALIYTAKVIEQHDDGTVDLRLEGSTLEPRNVRLDVGIPGCRVFVDAGQEVKLAFKGGQPDGAYAFGIPLDATAARGVVAVGDLGDGGVLAVAMVLGVPTFTYVAPSGGAPQVGTTVTLATKATNGSTKVKLT